MPRVLVGENQKLVTTCETPKKLSESKSGPVVPEATPVYVNYPPTNVSIHGSSSQAIHQSVATKTLSLEVTCRCGTQASCLYFRRETATNYVATPFCNLCRLSRKRVAFLGKPKIVGSVPLSYVPPLHERVPIFHTFECQTGCGGIPNYIKQIANKEYLLCSNCNRRRITELKEELALFDMVKTWTLTNNRTTPSVGTGNVPANKA